MANREYVTVFPFNKPGKENLNVLYRKLNVDVFLKEGKSLLKDTN